MGDEHTPHPDTLPQGEREAKRNALTSWHLFRKLSPRRRWAGWLVAYGVSAFLTAAILRCWFEEATLFLVMFFFVPAAALAAIFFPAALAPVDLFADVHSGALDSIILTDVDRRALLRTYLLRTLANAALLWGLLALPSLFLGHAPAPLLLTPKVWLSCWDFPDADNLAVSSAGALSDAASMYLAGCVGLACAVSLRRRGVAVVAALAVCAVMLLNAAVGGWLLHFLEPLGSPFFSGTEEMQFLPARLEGFATLAEVFAAVHLPVCLLLGELFLRGAARQLDRLVTD